MCPLGVARTTPPGSATRGGVYDNEGYRFRGHQVTDARGRYSLFTVAPGLYPGRTRHIHVKVQARGKPALTTQLFFPGAARNRSDGIFGQLAQLKSSTEVGARHAAPGGRAASHGRGTARPRSAT